MEGRVYYGSRLKPWQQDPKTARTLPTAGKQRAVDAGAQFTLSFLHSPQPGEGASHIQAQSSHFSELSLETPSHMCPLKLTVSAILTAWCAA